MKKKGESFFWTSFADLMTSLFFIVLVLYVLTYIMLKKKEKELVNTVADLKHKLEVYELVEQNLKPLKQDTLLFRYEENYKRFTLAFDVNFALGKSQIQRGDLNNYDVTATKIESVGKQLQITIDNLARNKAENPAMNNVSYLVIISGYASHLLSGSQISDYELSYQRAYNLWGYWKNIGIDFEANKYKGLIDLQIAGNGWGGVGRFERDPQNFMANETKNQRFIIQIVPKIGNTNTE
jgi:outer membrane protein OmpA-like peptidoglycan-associated protein